MKKYSYSVILQQKGTSSNIDEQITAYLDLIKNGVQNATAELLKTKTEAIQKNGTILRGGLTHFLSTPLKSDKDDIVRLINDSIENAVKQLDVIPDVSSIVHSLWKVLDTTEVPLQRQVVGVMKRLLKNGRTMLSDAGCSFGKNSGDTFFSIFSYDGFATVKSIKTIVDQSDALQVTVVNGSLTSTLTAIEQSETEEKNLVIINFQYADDSVVAVINERLPSVLDQFGIKNLLLSKQTLHGGFGGTYQIRFGVDLSKYALGSVIMSLTGENSELEDAITTNGSLIVLEKV